MDAFTNQPYRGNPAGVCVLEAPRDEAWMQNVASEMNLSETAFVQPQGEDFHLRWFTPSQEMYLCGHATLAAAHVLWEQGHLPVQAEAHFHTLSGLLRVTRMEEQGWMEMIFPVWTAREAAAPPRLETVIGQSPQWFGRNDHFGMAVLENPAQVEELEPDLGALRELPMDGLIVTAQGDGAPYDFVSRVFAPRIGIPEDPVTGGAHCMLTPFWAERLGKQDMTAYQASRRGGVLRVAPRGDKVLIRGEAVTVLHGELLF